MSPIYQHCCMDCEHEFETIQKMKDDPPPCEKCGGKTTKYMSSCSFRQGKGAWESNGYQGEGK